MLIEVQIGHNVVKTFRVEVEDQYDQNEVMLKAYDSKYSKETDYFESKEILSIKNMPSKQEVMNTKYQELLAKLDYLDRIELQAASTLLGWINCATAQGLDWEDNEDDYNEIVTEITALLEA